MLVYRDAERPALVEAEAEALDRIFLDLAEGRGSPRELATEALIEAGALEAGVVDQLNPARDGFGPREAAWRAVTLRAGRLFRASRREPALRLLNWRGRRDARWRRRARPARPGRCPCARRRATLGTPSIRRPTWRRRAASSPRASTCPSR